MPRGKCEFLLSKNIRAELNKRLVKEGRWDDYTHLKQRLILAGCDDSGDMAAWKIAAVPFSPRNGGPGELKSDPFYEAIVANWANGKYIDPPEFAKFPSGMTNFSKLEGEPSAEFKEQVEKIRKVPGELRDRWRKVSSQVALENADLVKEVLWVVAHRYTEPEEIDTTTAPSKAAVAKLAAVQESTANFMEFLRTNESKLIPDRRMIEYEARFKDIGQDLQLLDDEEQYLASKESAA